MPGDHPTHADETVCCRHCGRERGLIQKYDVNLCRQCFGEVARAMGFERTADADTESTTDEVPEGVVRGIRDVDESRTATRDDLEDALDF